MTREEDEKLLRAMDLRFNHGWSARRVADATGLPVETVEHSLPAIALEDLLYDPDAARAYWLNKGAQ